MHMGLKEVLEKLRSVGSVKAAYPLEGEIYDNVIAEESGVTESFTGMPLDNRALDEVLKRSAAVCLFCGSAFEVPSDHVLVMEDTEGNVVGHDIPACMAAKFKDNKDVFWFTEDFVIYPERANMHDAVMVMLPQKVTFVGESEGVRNAVLLYPATTTDLMLRMHFKVSLGDPDIASAILAFDVV
jgi:hypothetical protein